MYAIKVNENIKDIESIETPFNVDFYGGLMVMVDLIDGKYKIINAMNRYGNNCMNEYSDVEVAIFESIPAERFVSQAASQAVLPSVNPLTVEDLKCCGNCYYFDIIDNKGGVCDKDNNQMPCTKGAICEDWKFDAEK